MSLHAFRKLVHEPLLLGGTWLWGDIFNKNEFLSYQIGLEISKKKKDKECGERWRDEVGRWRSETDNVMAGAVSFVNSHNTELGSFPDAPLEWDSLLDDAYIYILTWNMGKIL